MDHQYFTLPGIFHMESIGNGWIPPSFHGFHVEYCITSAKIKKYTMEWYVMKMESIWNASMESIWNEYMESMWNEYMK